MNGLELIRAENPLSEPLGDYINLAEWSDRLLDDPLTGVDCRHLPERDRKLLLKQARRRFEPTEALIAIVSTIQDMLWNRIALCNPLLPGNRWRSVQALAQRGKSLHDALWLPDFADAFMVMGCTGVGKSKAIERYIGTIDKFYVHGRCDQAEWLRHAQVTYLVVAMPIHRGGLLYAILAGLDTTIGTSYRTQFADHRKWPIEKLAIEVGILLVQHSVGILIIEEIQARNFGMSTNREEMLLFILRLLNFGIPVVLVGNPLGFVGLEDFSQDINRLTENEPIHLMPPEVSDTNWSEGLGPGMWSYNVMPRPTRWSAPISEELHACSGGFPGYVRKAIVGAQELALSAGAKAVDISHLRQYRERSRTFALNRNLIEGFALKDPLKLMGYLDVPWEQYGHEWGKLSLEDIADASSEASEATDDELDEAGKAALRTVHQRIRAAAAAQLTRSKTKAARRTAAGPDAKAGLAKTGNALAAGLDVLRRNLAAPGPRLPKSSEK